MIQTIKNNIIAIFAITILSIVSLIALAPVTNAQVPPASSTAPAVTQKAQNETKCGSAINLEAANCTAEVDKAGGSVQNLIARIINTLSVIVGAICVIMIIIGGFRYVTSAGESNSVSGAKNTILYAIVGLIIVAFAQIIVQFVLQRTTS